MKGLKWWQKCYQVSHDKHSDCAANTDRSKDNSSPGYGTKDNTRRERRTSSKFYFDISEEELTANQEHIPADSNCNVHPPLLNRGFSESHCCEESNISDLTMHSTVGSSSSPCIDKSGSPSPEKNKPAVPAKLKQGGSSPVNTINKLSSSLLSKPKTDGLIMCARDSLYPLRTSDSCPPSPLKGEMSPNVFADSAERSNVEAHELGQPSSALPKVAVTHRSGQKQNLDKPPVGAKPTGPTMRLLKTTGTVETRNVLVTTGNARRSFRRSFTTEDIDIGISQKPVHAPLHRSAVPGKRVPSVLKRLEGTELGLCQGISRRLSSSLTVLVEKPKPKLLPKPKLDLDVVSPRSPSTPPHVANGREAINSTGSSSDSEISDVDSDHNVDSQDPPASPTARDETDGVVMEKAQRVAFELLTTEKKYVEELHLLDQTFHTELIHRNREERFLPEDVIPQMFMNIKSIYQFHHDFLLPKLEECMTNWESGQRISGVMKTLAPFLKMYSYYIQNFDSAMSLINTWTTKSAKFSNFLDEIQRRPECGCLTLQHHLLSPIQRVPRYELLLKEYLKHLDENSPDRTDAEAALSLVTLSAQHANEEIAKMERFRKLLEIDGIVGGSGVDLSDPNNRLIKQGPIVKISARDGDQCERYLYLFTSVLLVCVGLPSLPGIRQQFKVKARLDVSGMKVINGKDSENYYTFLIKSKQKSLEVCVSTYDQKTEWQSALWQAIGSVTKAERQFSKIKDFDQFKIEELGKRAPTWVKDQETYMCMICSSAFTTFRRRHHCRACGKVVCGNCSANKVALEYDFDRENRVCDACYILLRDKSKSAEDRLLADRIKARSILKVKGNDSSVISGYLMTSKDRKTWTKRWIAVHSNFVLYYFKANQEVVARETLPLPGYQVTAVSDSGSNTDCIFVLSHTSQSKNYTSYYFQAEDAAEMNRWVKILEYLVRLEIPPSIDSTDNASVVQSPVSSEDASSTEPVSSDIGDITPGQDSKAVASVSS